MRPMRLTTSRKRAALELELSYGAHRPWVPNARQLAEWATGALRPRKNPWVLSIRVVGCARSRSLNWRFRRRDKPTNVLSFEGAGTAPDGRCFIGELVICAPVVASEARAQAKRIEAHWAHMTVHGVLHLLGGDHERAAEAEKMERREVQILDRLGFSDPYR